jgi:hypothetical protein
MGEKDFYNIPNYASLAVNGGLFIICPSLQAMRLSCSVVSEKYPNIGLLWVFVSARGISSGFQSEWDGDEMAGTVAKCWPG